MMAATFLSEKRVNQFKFFPPLIHPNFLKIYGKRRTPGPFDSRVEEPHEPKEQAIPPQEAT